MGFIAALILLGILIFVHELGHFLMAKLFNVKVDAFQLGFGPRIIGKVWGETDYRIALVPLGGYVKLVGETPDELETNFPEEFAGRTLQEKKFYQKALILVAGPGMNLLFPIFLYFFMALTLGGKPVDTPTIGSMWGDAAIKAGLKVGDVILKVNGEEVEQWSDLQKYIMRYPNKEARFTVKRGSETIDLTVIPEEFKIKNEFKELVSVGLIGVAPYFDPPVLGGARKGSAGAEAGLKTGDVILAVDGAKVGKWIDAAAKISEKKGAQVELSIQRKVKDASPEKLAVSLKVPDDDPEAGLLPPASVVGEADEKTEVGKNLLVGDRIIDINGKPVRHFMAIQSILPSLENSDFAITIERDGAKLTYVTRLTKVDLTGPYKDLGPIYKFGAEWVGSDVEAVSDRKVVGLSPVRLVKYAFAQTWDITVLGVKSMQMIFTGKASLKQLGGPIMIFDVASRAYETGWFQYVKIMALISVSLGLLNLMPIPVMDGGQLVIYGVEALRGKRLSTNVREKANLVGLILLVLLMVLVFKNDIERYGSTMIDWIVFKWNQIAAMAR